MRRMLRLVVRLAVIGVVACGMSLVGWWFAISPLVPTIGHSIAYVLDWPVALVGTRLFPNYFAGIDLFFGTNMCDFCTARELLIEHSKFAVPVYFAILSVASLAFRHLRRRVHEQQSS